MLNHSACMYYRPQTKFAKVTFLHLSVSHSVQRGGTWVARGAYMAVGHAWCGAMWQGACMAGGMHDWGVHGRGHAWQGACMAGGMHGRGMCDRGHAWQGTHAPQQILRDTVNERVVRILLECILV